MATPFKFVIKARGVRTGRPTQIVLTCSDVNAEYAKSPSGASAFTLDRDDNWMIVDVISAAAASVTTADIYVGGKIIPETLIFASNLATNQARQFMGSGITIKGGSQIEFIQRT